MATEHGLSVTPQEAAPWLYMAQKWKKQGTPSGSRTQACTVCVQVLEKAKDAGTWEETEAAKGRASLP